MEGLQLLCVVRPVAFLGFHLVLGTSANIWGKRLSLQLSRFSLRKCKVQVGDVYLWGKRVFPLASFSSCFTYVQNNDDVLLRFVKAVLRETNVEKLKASQKHPDPNGFKMITTNVIPVP